MSPQLKIALIRRLNHQGFAIPIAISLGLIMILLATITIFKSQEETLNASTQRVSSRALSAAQSGVAKYQELINNNRVIATYSACAGGWNASDACTDNGTVASWHNPFNSTSSSTPTATNENIPGITQLACSSGGATTVKTATTRAWTNVDASNASAGQYRLLDYVYDDTTDPTQPVGRLTIQGRANQSNATTSSDTDPSTATAQLEVEIPVQPGLPPVGGSVSLDAGLNGLNPAVWINSSSVTDIGDLSVNGNIWLVDTNCSVPTGSNQPSSANLTSSSTQAVIASPRELPDVIDISSITINRISNADLNTVGQLPRTTGSDLATSVGGNSYYYYVIDNTPTDTADSTTNDNLDLSNASLTIREGTKVIIYVQGQSITFNNTSGSAITVNKTAGNNNTSAYLEIYGSAATTAVNFTGTGSIEIKALLHAPDATVNITGSPTVDIIGAVWVNDWNDTSSSTNISVSSDDQYYYYSSLDPMTAVGTGSFIVPPTISSPSSWETQEVE